MQLECYQPLLYIARLLLEYLAEMSFVITLLRIDYALKGSTRCIVPFFLAHKVGRLTCVSIFCGFCFDRIVISKALFTFPVKGFMQELIYSMFLRRFHVKDRSVLFSKKL